MKMVYSNVNLYCASVCFVILCMVDFNTADHFVRGGCKMTELQCNSGECIDDESKLCDGIADCSDHSDEISEACLEFPCPQYTYRCKYGACVRKSAPCDGIKDCFDGSDEADCPGNGHTTQIPPLPINCHIPNHPEHGHYAIGGAEAQNYNIGDVVPPFSVLGTHCDHGYQISPPDKVFSVCNNGIWTPVPSTCSSTSTG